MVEFANGLQPKDDAISYPPGPDEQFGFNATVLPDTLEEDPVGPLNDLADFRRVVLENGPSRVEIAVDTRGELAFEAHLGDWLLNYGAVEQVSLMDRPALLFDRDGLGWSLIWRHRDATVEVTLDGIERSTVDEIVDGLREISDDEWHDLVAAFE